jgi:hypothetical protein
MMAVVAVGLSTLYGVFIGAFLLGMAVVSVFSGIVCFSLTPTRTVMLRFAEIALEDGLKQVKTGQTTAGTPQEGVPPPSDHGPDQSNPHNHRSGQNQNDDSNNDRNSSSNIMVNNNNDYDDNNGLARAHVTDGHRVHFEKDHVRDNQTNTQAAHDSFPANNRDSHSIPANNHGSKHCDSSEARSKASALQPLFRSLGAVRAFYGANALIVVFSIAFLLSLNLPVQQMLFFYQV